ncbi:TonB-dependent receptor [Chitinophaga sp. Mgbs1]|uniref:TonB-dependent receptor n=1 Tax=Chitinophaga solisilvae TaxID=1233460 RepID=A0A3S1BPA3_9BACT|nr:TonB-dependent receptor [Chitinophaga solisilvae]
MRTYFVALLCLLGMICNSLFAAETGEVLSGRVITSGGEPAAAVVVMIDGNKRIVVTDNDGNFIVRNITAGQHQVKVSLMGYEAVVKEVTVLQGTNAHVEIQLKISSTELKEVIIADHHNKVADKRSEYVSRMELDNLRNPQVYSVASKELLLEKNVMDYQSAVKAIPGIVLSTNDYQGSSVTFMRGFAINPYIRNGIYFNNLMAGDPQNIERLEAVKGPAGTLYGSQGVSYGGLINKVTKKPLQQFMGEVGVSAGSYDYKRVTADVNTPLNAKKTALMRINTAATWQQSFLDTDFQRAFLAAPSFSFQLNEKLSILVDAELNWNSKPAITSWPGYSAGTHDYTRYDQIPLDYYATYGNRQADYPPSSTYNIFAQVNYKLNNKWKISTNIAMAHFNYNSGTIGLTLLDPATAEGRNKVGRDIYDFYWTFRSIEIQPNLTGEFRIGAIKNKLLVGLDIQRMQTYASGYSVGQQDTISLTAPYPPFPIQRVRASQAYKDAFWEADFKQKTYAAYITDVIDIGERLNVMLSLRYDHYKDGGYKYRNSTDPVSGPDAGSVAPKLGATYQLLKDRIVLFANYMQGINYVAPDMEGHVFKPERARQTEGGVKIDLADGRLTSTISYYDILVKDKVRPNPENRNASIQDGSQQSRGVDIEIMATPVKGLNIVTGYGYNDSQFARGDASKSGKRPFGTPASTANAWISYTLQRSPLKGLGIGVGVLYTDDFFATDDNTLTIPGYTLFNTNIFYNHRKFRISAGYENIGNIKYWDVYGAPQVPGKGVVTVMYRF